MTYYAVKFPVRNGWRVSVVSDLPEKLHKSAEIRRISDADRCKGIDHLLALFEKPPARAPFVNQVNRRGA